MKNQAAVWFAAALLAGCAGADKKECKMQAGDVIHGFTVKSVTELPEVNGRLWRMEYAKNGADLAWLERDEDNKTFAIAFKTLPADDTGVAHILEHSVLCGSEKYPSKEPFVDLLKGSLATFLNAMTYPDKTVYPVASRNDRDFLNLMDVYLDAVFHPLSVKDPHALAQEGWHYEIDSPTGALTRNGVVYSEMKGVFANPDSVVFRQTMHALYPTNTYGFESGGDPASIPDLTFEKYRSFHARFYHPSNSRIFLDGAVDLDAALAKLDEFLSPFARISPDADIPMQPAISTNAVIPYEIGPDESEKDKTILADGFVFGTFADRERQLAFSVLSEVLAGSNESPLKKPLLEAGLCEDLEFGAETLQQPLALVVFRNVPDGKSAEARRLFYATFEKIARDGLDRKQMESTLDHLEFTVREKDSGHTPRGLAFMDAALEGWLYGGDPAEAFRFAKLFGSIREKIANGGMEKYLREIFLDNPHRSQLDFTPSKTLGAERRAKEERDMAALKASWSADEIAARVKACAELKARQKAADRPEDVAKLPKLARADIPLRGPEVKIEERTADGVTTLRAKTGADGIFYLELHFPLAALSADELSSVPLYAALLGELATAHFDALALKGEVDGNLGRFSSQVRASKRGPYFSVHVSALESKRADAVRLLKEVLLTTKFDDRKAVADIIKQSRQDMERSFASSGQKYAMRRAASTFSAANALEETLDGVDQLRWLQRTDKDFAKNGDALLSRYVGFSRRLFVRAGLVVAASDNSSDEWLRNLAAEFPAGGDAPKFAPAAPAAPRREGFVIPGDVGFAGVASKLDDGEFDGSAIVASRILSLDWLWNQIRVLGGAYGMGLTANSSGDVKYMTYRDPNPKRSFGKISECGAELAKFAAGGADLDKYVVSAIGKTEPYLTPRLETTRAADLYFAERTPEDLQRVRGEILTCDGAKLAAWAKKLDALRSRQGVCLVGGKQVVDACSNLLDRVESVQQ